MIEITKELRNYLISAHLKNMKSMLEVIAARRRGLPYSDKNNLNREH